MDCLIRVVHDHDPQGHRGPNGVGLRSRTTFGLRLTSRESRVPQSRGSGVGRVRSQTGTDQKVFTD